MFVSHICFRSSLIPHTIQIHHVRAQLMKARGTWARLGKVLQIENVPPRISGMFYPATIQAVLLYGSETWNLTPRLLVTLEGFHVHAARRITDMMPKKGHDKVWQYPSNKTVLRAAGLRNIAHYITVWRKTVAEYSTR